MLARIPDNIRSRLEPFFRNAPEVWDADLVVTEPARMGCCTIAAANGYTKIGGNPAEGVIEIHPDHFDPESPEGLALVAHELFHEWQREAVPDFSRRFAQEGRETAAAGLPPWENGFERAAYQFEAHVRRALEAA